MTVIDVLGIIDKEFDDDQVCELIKAILVSQKRAAEELNVSDRRIRTLISENQLRTPIEGAKAVLRKDVENYKDNPKRNMRPHNVRKGK